MLVSYESTRAEPAAPCRCRGGIRTEEVARAQVTHRHRRSRSSCVCEHSARRGLGNRPAELVAEGHVCGQALGRRHHRASARLGDPAPLLLEADRDDSQGRAAPLTTSAALEKSLTFRARPTGRTGVYRARVVFPNAGMWRYEVYDAFTEYGGARTHTFAPVKIAAGRT